LMLVNAKVGCIRMVFLVVCVTQLSSWALGIYKAC
jgi:hypothetical protein